MKSSHSPQAHFPHLFLVYPSPSSSFHLTIIRHMITYLVRRWSDQKSVMWATLLVSYFHFRLFLSWRNSWIGGGGSHVLVLVFVKGHAFIHSRKWEGHDFFRQKFTPLLRNHGLFNSSDAYVISHATKNVARVAYHLHKTIRVKFQVKICSPAVCPNAKWTNHKMYLYQLESALIKPMTYNFWKVSNGMVCTISFSNQNFLDFRVNGKDP